MIRLPIWYCRKDL